MCIIIAKPAGVEPLDKAYFERAWAHNSDGAGYVYKIGNDKVRFRKGFMDKDTFLKRLEYINKKETSYIIHFRISSKGAVCPANTHPFRMKYVSIAHNGTLGITPFEGRTDTETFCLAFLANKDMSWIKKYATLLEMALGSSKFAIMDNRTGEIFILNPQCGKYDKDIWFSNTSADPVANCSYDAYGRRVVPTKPPRRTFGTNSYEHATYDFYSTIHKCWCSNATMRPDWDTFYGRNFVISKRGEFELYKDVQPKDDYPKKKYPFKCSLNALLKDFQKHKNVLKNQYMEEKCVDSLDLKEKEHEISAVHCLIDTVNRLTDKDCEVCRETLNDMIMQSFSSPIRNLTYVDFQAFCALYIDEFIVKLNKLDGKVAQLTLLK